MSYVQFVPTEGYTLGICGRPTHFRPPPRVHRIKQAVADYYCVSMADMDSDRRSRHISRPRQMAMFLAREKTTLSLPNIGRQFNRDHTTVIHAIDAVRRRLATNADERADVEYLRGKLRG